jgi:hypothetical protein
MGLATGASALSVPDLAFSGNKISGSIAFDVVGATLEMVVTVDEGKLARTRVSVADSGGVVRAPVDAGSVDGSGVNVKRIRIRSDGSVEFAFKQSFWRQHISAGQSSDMHYIDYGALAAGDVISITGYRHQIFGSFGSNSTTIVPEPSTAILVGLGVLGLAVAGRRRE